MRLFISISIPSEVQKKIFKDRETFSLQGAYTKTKELHITLTFLGEISAEKLSDIIAHLTTITDNSFIISTQNYGFFPSEHSPKVWWLGLADETRVIQLKKKIDVALQLPIHSEVDFRPHITLARISSLSNKAAFFASINSTLIQQLTWNVDHFHLMQSMLTPQGPAYSIVSSFKLKDLT